MKNKVTSEKSVDKTTTYCPLLYLSAFNYGSLEFFGGSKFDLALENGFDLLINLTGTKFSYTLPVIDREPQLFENFFRKIDSLRNVPQLVIQWDDYSIPDFPPSVWAALAEDLRILSRSKEGQGKRVAIGIFCAGGTGRTGTALAILRSLLVNDGIDPVAIIRKVYKVTAIETDSQVRYIERVTGIKSNCVGSKPKPTTTYKGTTATATVTKSNAVTGNGKTCTHKMNIPGCKGGCNQFYKSTPPTECSHGIAFTKHCKQCDEKYGLEKDEQAEEAIDGVVMNTPDCPACKLGGTNLSHTTECNDRYFEASGICKECFEDVSKDPKAHKQECSRNPLNLEEESVDDTEQDNISLTIAEAIANGDYRDNEDCPGCVTGKWDSKYHTPKCNDEYFKREGF